MMIFNGRVFSILLQRAAQILARPIPAGLCRGCPSQHLNSDQKTKTKIVLSGSLVMIIKTNSRVANYGNS